MKNLLRTRLVALMITFGFTQLIRAFVFSTRFGKQTYSKRAIRTVWEASRR